MAKTIFHTTEKSNFILNMTEEQYSRVASFGLIAAMFAVPLFTILPEATGKASYAIPAVGLAVAGVINMILALIAMIKKYIDKKALLPVCAFTAMLAWGAISLADGYELGTGFYGYPERGEGLLAILFYFGFFVTALSIKRENVLKTLINGIIGVGLLNCVVSFVQIFAGQLSHYKSVSFEHQINAASGLSHSPLFLAMVLTLALTAALVGFVTSESPKRSIFCIASAAIFSFVMIFTYSLIGICGLVFSAIAAVIAVFAMKAKKIRLLSVLSAALPAVLAVVIVNAGLIGNISSYRLYDGRILWWADSYMRASASGNVNSDILDIDNTADVYLYLNDKTMDIIRQYPATGTGPEQLVYPQLYTSGGLANIEMVSDFVQFNTGSFDKVYNEYLYTAATRGVPSLIALVLTLLPALVIGFKSLKKRKTPEAFTFFILTLGGALLFLIGCSSIAFAPVIWTAAGASCIHIATPQEKKAEKKISSKKK